MRLRILIILVALGVAGVAHAWPSDNQWRVLAKGGGPIQDLEGDANGGVNVVPNDGTHPAAYIYNDGTYLFYRLRLDGRPDAGGNGILAQFGWGFEVDIDQDADDYEWLVMCDGISSPETVSLAQNTVQTEIGDPSDKAEVLVATWPMVGNHRIVAADTSINSDQDYFLDYRIPVDVFKQATGIQDSTLIRYMVGSSRSTNNLTDNGADLVAGSSLYDGLSDYLTLTGELPVDEAFHDGAVRFVTSLGGYVDQAYAAPGNTLYLRVDDLDLDDESLPGGEIRVQLTTPAGDLEVVDLVGTGVAGKYTGSIATTTGGVSVRNGTLQVAAGTVVTVTYVDAVTAARTLDVSRTDTLTISASATDVGLTHTVSNSAPSPGNHVTFTIKATNHGPPSTTTLTVTDALPAGLTYVSSAVSTGSFNSTTRVWTIGALARDASATLTVTAAVGAGTSGQTLTSTASVTTVSPTDSFTSNNSASASVYVGGTDLRVTQTVSDATPPIGGNVTFTVRVRNAGPQSTTGVAITDLLPAGLALVSATPAQGTYAGGTGVWTVGALSVGQETTLALVATTSGTPGATLTSTASLTATAQPDSNGSNNSASTSVRIGLADLGVTMSVSDQGPGEGTSITYTVVVANSGPNPATTVRLTDVLPTGLTYQSDAATQGGFASGTGVWTIGTLASGASATLTLSALVNAGTTGATLLNEARITALDQHDGTSANNVASVTIGVGGADLAVAKVASTSSPAIGATVNWTITVTNHGPSAATGVQITDLIPSGVSHVKVGGNVQYTAGQGTFTSSTGVWAVGALAVGTSATLTLPTTVDPGTAGRNITNVAYLTATGQADGNDANNVDSATIGVQGTDLSITKTVNVDRPNEGDDVVYTLTARNHGPNAATGVVVSDLLPPELLFVSSTPSTGAYVSSTGLWTIGSFANGATATLTITAQVRTGNDKTVIANTASIDASGNGETDPSDDRSTVTISVGGTDLGVTQTASTTTPAPGSNVVLTVTLRNLTSGAATSIEVQDYLPSGLTLVSATPSVGTYGSGLWMVGTLAGNATATLTITATVGASTGGTTVTNTAAVTYLDQLDTSGGNDSAAVSLFPAPPPDLTMVKSADAVTVVPGQIITYTLVVQNTGAGAATSVVLSDRLNPHTAFSLNGYGPGAPFSFTDGVPASGLSLGTPAYSNDGGATFTYTPVSGGGGAPPGYDSAVTHWRITMSGTQAAARGFTVAFRARVR